MSTIALVLQGALATIVLWAVSAIFGIALGFLLACGFASRFSLLRGISYALANLSRAIPTSFYVLATGVAAMRLPPVTAPIFFVGTPPALQVVAFAICLALAFGSAGHIAHIFI